jgi:hypothetical protein
MTHQAFRKPSRSAPCNPLILCSGENERGAFRSQMIVGSGDVPEQVYFFRMALESSKISNSVR